jgi:DNA invertase Pin-like site-specific DNA recombinase
MCRSHRATLVIAKLDRLTRDAHFLPGLQKAGIDFVAADMPSANRMTVGIMAVVAEEERRMISARTKAALAAAKARGTKLDGLRFKRTSGAPAIGTEITAAATRAGRSRKAARRAADLAPLIKRLDSDSTMSLRALARALNEEGVPTATGRGEWTAAGVARLQAHLRVDA